MSEPLFDPSFRRRIAGLRLFLRRRLLGLAPGDRAGLGRGGQLDFADFKSYAPGDDFRNIDWNLYARLDELFVRQYTVARDWDLVVAVDSSASMNSGRSSKGDAARRLAGALAILGIEAGGAVHVWVLAGGPARHRGKGKAEISGVLEFIERTRSASGGEPAARLERLVAERSGRCALVAISDFYEERQWKLALRKPSWRGWDVTMFQILSEEELHPQPQGEVRLVDSESGLARTLTLDAETIARYLEELDRLLERWRVWSWGAGIRYRLASSSESVHRLLLRTGGGTR